MSKREIFAGHGYYDNYATCKECRQKHLLPKGEGINSQRWLDWLTQHPGHSTAVVPQWLMEAFAEKVAFSDNADVKIAYAASGTYTFTLTGLATDASLLTGRESTGISNATNKYLDELVSGLATTGTSPTDAKQIEVYAVGARDDTPNYPSVFDGTDSAETVSASSKASICRPLAIVATTNTSDQGYHIGLVGIRQLFGDGLPVAHVLFLTHNTGVNFNATASNHSFAHTPVYSTIV